MKGGRSGKTTSRVFARIGLGRPAVFQGLARGITTCLQPKDTTLWAGTLFLLLFAALVIQPLQPADFWWHLQVGEVVLDEGRIPRTDLFTYTVPGRPYIYQGWLAGVFFALLYRLGGTALVVVVNALLLTLSYGLLWWICRQESGHAHLATACTFAAAVVSLGNWTVRPQTLSTLLFALFLSILVRFRRGRPTPLWLLPPLIALWANLHGAFVLGLFLLGATLVGEVGKTLLPGRPFPTLPARSRRALLGTTLTAAAAPLLNPVGWRIFSYLVTIQSNPIIRRYMAEWKPPRPDDAVGGIFYLSLLLLFLLLLYRQHRPDPVEALWLSGTAWLALGGVRSILWYSLTMGLLAAQGLAGLSLPPSTTHKRWQGRLNLFFLLLLGGLALLATPWAKGLLPLPPDLQGTIAQHTPVGATDFLVEEGIVGPTFHRMEYGGYLFWRFYPQRVVFIDARIELFPPDLWDDYTTISAGGPGTAALLEHYGVEVLLLDTRFQAGLLEWAQTSGRWRLRYQNLVEHSAVLTPNIP